MAITATLKEQGNNRLRYLIANNGTATDTVTITTTGAATPDLQTDSLVGPVKQISQAFTNGLGKLPAGAMTQAQSQAMWLADDADTVLGSPIVPRAICRYTGRVAGLGAVQANVDGQGHPTLEVAVAAGAEGYLDVEVQGAIGR